MQPDVIIVGGGVIGAACAYFLSELGAKILVLERSHLGAGASGTTAAIVGISGSSGTPEPLRPLNVEGYHLILKIAQDFERPLEIIHGGALYAAMNDQEELEIRPFYDEIQQMGIDCNLLDAAETRRFEPLLCPDVRAALYNPACFHVNPFRLVQGYLGVALRRGCITPVQAGQQITLQEGYGKIDLESSAPPPGRLVRRQVAVVIVGAGPAGLSAALAAARSGTRVLVIDENLLAGGQIYRQLPPDFEVNDATLLGSDYVDGRSLLGRVRELSERIEIWNDALVWSVFESRQLAVARGDELVLIDADAIIVDVDTVCIGYGLIPSIWLTSLLGCRHVYDPLVGGWVPYFDENMQTDQSGIFVAGDGAGIAGVLAAKMQGSLAGLYAAVHTGDISIDQAVQTGLPELKQLESIGRFRYAMDRIYRIYPDLYANVTDDTIVCRCESITAGEIRQAAREGTMDLNDIKKRTRSGMGYCQGTNCQPAITAILSREFDVDPAKIKMVTTRPPARPIPLSLLMFD